MMDPTIIVVNLEKTKVMVMGHRPLLEIRLPITLTVCENGGSNKGVIRSLLTCLGYLRRKMRSITNE